jgi:hypothetical protein
VFLNKFLDSKSTSHEWSQRCISRNIQIDSFVKHHAKIFEMICVGELRTIKVEQGQIVRPGIEAHHLRFQCVDSQRLPFSISSQLVQHGLHVGMVIGHEREVISEQ